MDLLTRIIEAVFGSKTEAKHHAELEAAAKVKLKQLEMESDAVKRITEAAEKEIQRCWEAYGGALRFLRFLVVLVLAIGTIIVTFFGWKSWSAINASLTEIPKLAESTAKKEVAKQFEDEAIKKMVKEAAKDRVEAVADQLIQSNVNRLIIPLRTESQLIESNLQQTVQEAQNLIKRLNEDSDFVIKATLAQNDDRSAYEQLVKWGEQQGYRHKERAIAVSYAIQAGCRFFVPAFQSSPFLVKITEIIFAMFMSNLSTE